MSRLSEFFKKIEPIDSESIKNNLEKLLTKFGFDGIFVGNIHVGLEGEIMVDFTDIEDDYMRVIFAHDESEGSYAMIASDEDDILLIDLEPMRPVLRKTQIATFVDLSDSTWITRSLLTSIFRAGHIEDGKDTVVVKPDDEYNVYHEIDVDNLPPEGDRAILRVGESRRVFRGGKNVRIPVIVEKTKAGLTLSQKENLVKSLVRRNEKSLGRSLRLTKE